LKRFSLSRFERVKKKNEFNTVYNNGRTILSSDLSIKSIYIVKPNSTQPGIQIAAAVSKKAGKAVWRNRAKRLIKEAYRLNKYLLLEPVREKKIKLLIVFTLNKLSEHKKSKINLNDISPSVIELINNILQKI
jgi:ribonuclease P protein component